MNPVEELMLRVVQLKAQEHSLEEAIKVTHDELMISIGKVQGFQQSHAELEKKFELPLTPEIEEKVMAIIRDIKTKATKAPKT